MTDGSNSVDQTLSLSLGYDGLPHEIRSGQSWIPNFTCPKEMFFNPPSYTRDSLHTSHINLALFGGEGRGGEGRGSPGIHCMRMCGYIIQILDILITYGYVVVYLPFDLNSSRSTFLEMAGLDSLNFERCCRVDR